MAMMHEPWLDWGSRSDEWSLGCGHLTFKASASFGSYVDNIIRLPLAIKDWHPHGNNISSALHTAIEELCERRWLSPAVCAVTDAL